MNQIVTHEPRQQPLTAEKFLQLEAAIEKSFTAKPVFTSIRVPVKDDLGNIYRWEHDLIETGLSLVPNGNPDPRLVDAMKRPATAQAIALHLKRLESHKRHVRGGFSWQVIVEDAVKDLIGVSEWAVMKAYDRLRKTEGDFFPSVNEIVKAVRFYDDALKTEPKANVKPIPKTESVARNAEKVAEILHTAGIPHSKEFCQQCKGAV